MPKCNHCEYSGDNFHESCLTKCRSCFAKTQREYRQKRPKGHWRHKDKQYGLKKKYGLNLQEFELRCDAQNWKCEICGGDNKAAIPSKRLLQVDHDHANGKVRGFLCDNCNNALGRIKDRPEIAERMARYLRKYRTLHEYNYAEAIPKWKEILGVDLSSKQIEKAVWLHEIVL